VIPRITVTVTDVPVELVKLDAVSRYEVYTTTAGRLVRATFEFPEHPVVDGGETIRRFLRALGIAASEGEVSA
jgi:hypothetical protein